MSQKPFHRGFVIYLAVLFSSVVFINIYLTKVIRSNYMDSLVSDLAVRAVILSDTIPFSSSEKMSGFCKSNKAKARARVTVIDPDGIVLCDSDYASKDMENHADRPEIQRALTSESGWAVRFSKTLNIDLLYTSSKWEKNGKLQGFIRLAVPLTDVNESINNLRIKINLAVILVFLVMGLVHIRQSGRIRAFVLQVAEYAGALSRGLFKKKLYLEGAGEFTELAHNLNNMASELESNIEKKEEEKNRLSVVLKSIPDAFLLINTDDVIEMSNLAAKDLFGQSELEGRSYLEVVRSPDFLSLIDRVKSDRASGSADIVIDFPVETYLTVRVSPLSYIVGEVSGLVAIFHDTTRMKRLEQMRKDFVANVSHEIKTPVTAIQGFAETLIDGAVYDKENAAKFLGTIKSHSQRLNRLVDDLLTLSKIELGVIKIQKVNLGVADIVDSVTGTMIVQAAKKNITIKKSVDASVGTIAADRDGLEQVLLNLVDNAIKFTDQGDVEIGTCSINKRSCLYVKDFGDGIPEKYISRVGERFFRVDPSRSRELGGTGLGLAIVKHIVHAHGWEMEIESEVGKGTTVKLFYD